MNDPQRAITGLRIINNDSECNDICLIIQAHMTIGHFTPNGIELFLPAKNLGLNTGLFQKTLKIRDDKVLDIFRIRMNLIHTLQDRFISLWIDMGKGQAFQLFLDFLHTNPLGQGRINFQSFPGNAHPFFWFLDMV